MKLSTDLQVDGTTRQTRAIVCAWLVYALRTRRVQDLPETRSDYVVTAVPTGLLSAANSLLFWANGLHAVAPELQMVRRVKVPTRDLLLTADGVPKISTRSRHSRRTVPIRRSTYGFCQGDRGEIGRSRMPIALTRVQKACP